MQMKALHGYAIPLVDWENGDLVLGHCRSFVVRPQSSLVKTNSTFFQTPHDDSAVGTSSARGRRCPRPYFVWHAARIKAFSFSLFHDAKHPHRRKLSLPVENTVSGIHFPCFGNNRHFSASKTPPPPTPQS